MANIRLGLVCIRNVCERAGRCGERFEIENANQTPVSSNRGRGRHSYRSRLSRTRRDDRHAAIIAGNGIVGTGACPAPEDWPNAYPGGPAASCEGRPRCDHAEAWHYGLRDQFAAATAAARGTAWVGAPEATPG